MNSTCQKQQHSIHVPPLLNPNPTYKSNPKHLHLFSHQNTPQQLAATTTVMKLSLPPLLAFLFFLLAASTATEAYGEEDQQEGSSCQLEMMRHSIDRCRSFLRQGRQQGALLSSVVDSEDDDGNAGAPQECCAQLGQLSEHCRCASIRDMLQEVKWEEGFRGRECRGRCAEMMMRGRLLPEMCNLRPHTCKMRTGSV